MYFVFKVSVAEVWEIVPFLQAHIGYVESRRTDPLTTAASLGRSDGISALEADLLPVPHK